VVLVGEPEQPRANEGTARQVEAAHGLLAGAAQGLGLAGGRGEAPQLLDGERPGRRRVDDLRGAAVAGDERGAQDLVPGDDRLDRPPHGLGVEGPAMRAARGTL